MKTYLHAHIILKHEQCKQKHMQSIRCDSSNFCAKHNKFHRSYRKISFKVLDKAREKRFSKVQI